MQLEQFSNVFEKINFRFSFPLRQNFSHLSCSFAIHSVHTLDLEQFDFDGDKWKSQLSQEVRNDDTWRHKMIMKTIQNEDIMVHEPLTRECEFFSMFFSETFHAQLISMKQVRKVLTLHVPREDTKVKLGIKGEKQRSVCF